MKVVGEKDGSSFAAWKWVESPCASCCQGEPGTEDAEFITWERIDLIERIGLSSVSHVDNNKTISDGGIIDDQSLYFQLIIE